MSFTEEQVETLLRPINPRRVMHANNQSHVSQQDIRAHLIRIFGFGGWDKEILDLRCVRDDLVTIPGKNGGRDRENVPAVTYVCRLRLTVYCPDRCCKKVSDDVGTGTSPNLPSYGDAHDFAAKNAVSYALKRCATDLGDQFGLSLYNKGQTSALVMRTLVGGPQRTDRPGAVDDDVPQQESLGDREPDYAEPDPPAPEPERVPPPAPSSGPLTTALIADINRYARVLGLDEKAVRIRMASTFGTTLVAATGGQLQILRDQLREEAHAAATPPNEGEQT